MKSVVVLGDVICDHNLYRGLRPTPDSEAERGLRTQPTPGGALLLHQLLEKTLATDILCKVQPPPSTDLKRLPDRYHAYAIWEPQPSDLSGDNDAKKRLVWRASEPPLGYGPQVPGAPSGDANPPVDVSKADILVLDDAGLDFRNNPLTFGKRQWIVLKLTGSIGGGALWNSLAAAKPENLVVILSADQLRLTDLRLDRGLSWEATLQHFLRELAHNPVLKPLALCRHLIVTFRSAGALWMPRPSVGGTSGAPRPLFVFDGERAEGEWRTAASSGVVFGYLSCFTAAVVHQLCAWKPDPKTPGGEPDLEAALVAGLGASRTLHRLGHGPVQPDIISDPSDKTGKQQIASPHPGFPFEGIATAIHAGPGNPEKFATTVLPSVAPPRPDWMMLDEWHVHAASEEHPRAYHDAAFAAAVLGPGALDRFPVARFGALRTVDRREIEGLRIIRQAMQDYRDSGKQSKPLNLGVFGPPGAGKSFGVQEIVKAVFGEKAPFLTFNLSQFSSPDMLNDAFHQIRDKVVAGETPVAFWDEFDSESFRWLQFLLAPMNDGVFQDGPVTHPIGKCVFIFAGATSHSFDTFGPINPDDPEILDDPSHPDYAALVSLKPDIRQQALAAWREFVLRKGPDFKSRLVATLDVLGPNPRQRPSLDPATGQRRWETDPSDRCWSIRRAFFIRSKFDLKESARLGMDHGLLRALLEIPRYKSGSRSLEFLCVHLRSRAGANTPRRSHLPGDLLLERHVNAKVFQEICDADTRFHEIAEALAPGLHESWRNLAATANPADQPWAKLADTYRQSTIQQALRIPRNLALVGLAVERGTFPSRQQAVARSLIEKNLERLAEAEHNGWMVERMLAGWRYARIAEKDEARKLHPLLVPYAQLSDREKEKDRQAVRSYVQRLKRAGYRIPTPIGIARKRPISRRRGRR